ncbi:MAG TPA: copper-binding protein [Burkholderiaceae bacterium]|nr:copper-binding protein [Burkholderiaceae bacterium]
MRIFISALSIPLLIVGSAALAQTTVLAHGPEAKPAQAAQAKPATPATQATPAQATPTQATPGQATPATQGAQAMTEMVAGEVRKVDKDTRKITLRHGEIKQLDMPAMTMVFQVKDLAMLEKIKAGDKVMFKAEGKGGALTVTEIEPAK